MHPHHNYYEGRASADLTSSVEYFVAPLAETFEAVMAPRRPLGPATADHIELPRERLRAGGTVQDWHDDWREFTRPDDILVMWGTFYRNLAAADGLPLAFPSLDLRIEASRSLRRRFRRPPGSRRAISPGLR